MHTITIKLLYFNIILLTYVVSPQGEDTHKQVFFSGRTTKGVGQKKTLFFL